MDKNSTPDDPRIAAAIQRLVNSKLISPKYLAILLGFYGQVRNALEAANRPLLPFYDEFCIFLRLFEEQLRSRFIFEPYHAKVRAPFDYYQFGLDFVSLLIDTEKSKIFGLDVATEIERQLEKGENAILLANHQTETDPLAISILLEKTHPSLAEKIIFVAGERVVTDPLAVPFSMGCDLLCIYSKRYISHPPERKAGKLLHNKNTMERMSRLLSDGGKVIYVAPSGGRDRRSKEGKIEVAPFDPQSVEMFYLMAKKSKTPAHFYPMALATYELMPPPETIQKELGEARTAHFTPVFLSFLPQFDMENYPKSADDDKIERRKRRATAIWNLVNQEHEKLIRL